VGLVYLTFYQAKYKMDVAYYNDAANRRISERSGKLPFLPGSFRKYTEFILTGDEKQNELYLNELINQSKQLKINKDTIHGYLIHFSKHTKYADVVKTFDICSRDSIGRMIYGDNVYVFWVKPRVQSKNAQRWLYNDVIYSSDDVPHILPQRTFFEDVRIKFKELFYNIKSFWPCLIPFVGMIYFWRKRNKWGVG
jgi:hypothetical protein